MTAKRAFDVFCSGTALLLLFPVFLVVAVVIRFDSPGPVFFRQVRIGRGGVPFRIHKFRTMRAEQPQGARQITVGADPRITRVGHFLRNSKIDELPQLIDVFVGKMSFVGPRPEVPLYVQHYPDAVRQKILSVRPGITDHSSLFFIDESKLLAGVSDPEDYYVREILPMKLRYHERYVEERSLLLDIRIIVATILSLFRRPD